MALCPAGSSLKPDNATPSCQLFCVGCEALSLSHALNTRFSTPSWVFWIDGLVLLLKLSSTAKHVDRPGVEAMLQRPAQYSALHIVQRRPEQDVMIQGQQGFLDSCDVANWRHSKQTVMQTEAMAGYGATVRQQGGQRYLKCRYSMERVVTRGFWG